MSRPTRQQADYFARVLLDNGPSYIRDKPVVKEIGSNKFPTVVSGKGPWHFGRCEIQALLDYIYEEDSEGRPVERID